MTDQGARATLCGVFTAGVLMIIGCSQMPNEIPERYRGEFAFDKEASIAYWKAQSEWPQTVTDSLVKMAIPTTVKIEAGRVVIVDVTTGESRIEEAKVRQIGSDFITLDLHSNFARTNRATTFRFDENGFWLLEDALFPNYRERFQRIRTAQKEP